MGTRSDGTGPWCVVRRGFRAVPAHVPVDQPAGRVTRGCGVARSGVHIASWEGLFWAGVTLGIALVWTSDGGLVGPVARAVATGLLVAMVGWWLAPAPRRVRR